MKAGKQIEENFLLKIKSNLSRCQFTGKKVKVYICVYILIISKLQFHHINFILLTACLRLANNNIYI